MATYRIGIGSFSLAENGGVGIGTDSAGLGNLKVEGTVKTTDLDVTGVSTFTRYAGFAADDLNINRDTSLTGEHFTTGDIVVGVNSTFTVSVGATVTVGTVESVSIGTHFSPPTGGVEDRPEAPVEGTVRFNIDLNTLEFYNGVEWRQFTVSGQRGRGLFAGGRCPAFTASIGYIEIATLGNSEYFGDLQQARESASNNVASSTRGLFAGGYHPGASDDEIGYVTIASEGNAIDFGNLSGDRYSPGGGSSSTRGIFGGGSPATNVIEYVEINTLGNAVDFGDLVTARRYPSGISSPVRTCFAGGTNVSSPYPPFNIIDYITTASKGNAFKFGEITATQFAVGGCSNSTRGLYHIGTNSWSPTWNSQNRVEYITLASEGNATNFGELTVARHYTGGVSSSVRGVFGGGFTGPGPTRYNTIDFVLIASTGNAQDFGDLMENRTAPGSACDSHGGLGGY